MRANIEQRLLAMFEQAPLGFFFLDFEFSILETNSVLASQLGAPSAQDLIGLRIPDDFPGLDFDPFWLDELRDQKRTLCAISGQTPWGRPVYLQLFASPFEDDGVVAYFAFTRDASEEHRIESEARASAARNEAILQATVEGIATIDTKGVLISVNPALERLFGYSQSELVGQNVRMIMPEPYRSQHDTYLERYLETGEPRIIGAGRELVGRRKDGTVFPVRLSVGEIQLEGERLFVGMLGDLSERQRAEREASTLGVILEDSLNEIYVFDDETLHFRMVNRGGRENLGFSPTELREMTPVDIKPEFSEHAFREMIAPLRAGTLPTIVFKTTHRRKDGSEYRVEVHLQHRADSGEFVAIVLDLTDREALESQLQQSQRLEALGQLAGGIAHDFNNLLTSIQGSSELLQSRLGQGDRSLRALQRIEQAASRGAALTQQLLAFSRRQVTQPEPMDLNHAVSEISELTGRLIGDDVELVLDFDPSLPQIVADPAQLDQVVMNLVVNAGDAMPAGGTLRVSTRTELVDGQRAASLEIAPGRAVVLEVADTGSGMSPQVLSRIFEPFYTTKEVGRGTGLGLSTVYGIVKQNGWGVEVESSQGDGTTFRVWIPSIASHSRSERAGPPARPTLQPGGGSILLVEDDALLRENATEVLEEAGFQVRSAPSPEAALQQIHELGEVELLVSDVVMPGMTGLELARRLRGTHPHLRVLLISGYPEAALERRDAFPAEFPVLPKPFSNEVLIGRIRELIRA